VGVATPVDLTPKQRDIVLALLKRFLPGVKVWVYGSRANGTSRSQSDLDMVAFASPEQTASVFALREAFDESDLPFRVDLILWHEIPEQFRRNIEVSHLVL
jgi:predicted nucleotidyltransferase